MDLLLRLDHQEHFYWFNKNYIRNCFCDI